MIQSMSRVGCSLDNAPTEGFWGIIKSEMYYNFKFENEDELRRTIKDYIFFYNNNGLMSIFWTQKVKLFYAALLANNSHCSGVM